MAPTVCNKKEPRVRVGASVVVRDSMKFGRNSTNSSAGSVSVVSYGGKITHRRSVAARSAKSKLLRVPDSESSSSDESEMDDYSRMDADDDFTCKEEASSASNHPATPDTISEFAPSPVASSEISSGCQCSDRLTVMTVTTDSAYGSTRCRYCSSPNGTPSRDAIEVLDDVATAAITKNIVVFNRGRNALSDDSASNYSAWDSDDCSSSNLDHKYYVSKKSHRNNRGLLEIAIKTVKLIKRNQLLQQKLTQLQFETRQFIESVMANPENQNMHVQIATDDRKEVEA